MKAAFILDLLGVAIGHWKALAAVAFIAFVIWKLL